MTRNCLKKHTYGVLALRILQSGDFTPFFSLVGVISRDYPVMINTVTKGNSTFPSEILQIVAFSLPRPEIQRTRQYSFEVPPLLMDERQKMVTLTFHPRECSSFDRTCPMPSLRVCCTLKLFPDIPLWKNHRIPMHWYIKATSMHF